jgi:hypothetical protein
LIANLPEVIVNPFFEHIRLALIPNEIFYVNLCDMAASVDICKKLANLLN